MPLSVTARLIRLQTPQARKSSKAVFVKGGDMPARKADAVWEGGLKGGHGKVTLGSGAFSGAYSFASRFADGTGTNPEDLIGAAHAGCYSMALSAGLERAGQPPRRGATTTPVRLVGGGDVPRLCCS